MKSLTSLTPDDVFAALNSYLESTGVLAFFGVR